MQVDNVPTTAKNKGIMSNVFNFNFNFMRLINMNDMRKKLPLKP